MSLLKWAVVFFVVSLIAALFGFTDIAAATADVARILFYIFLVIFIVLLVLGLVVSGRFLTDLPIAKPDAIHLAGVIQVDAAKEAR